MADRSTVLTGMGGEAGCRRLSEAFYARVHKDPLLRPFFPGKTVKCAIEEFTAFLIQFLGGDESQTQRRWWLSLRESHARFAIGPVERAAWLKLMKATLDESAIDPAVRTALWDFFGHSASYVIGQEAGAPADGELATRWAAQHHLDAVVALIAAGRVQEALAAARPFASRPAVYAGLLARMIESRSDEWTPFVLDAIARDPSLATRQSGGRALLHYAAGAGCLPVVTALLRAGADPDLRDAGDHTPLYRVANQCASAAGPEIVSELLGSGADVNARSGVTNATALHMAARRGFVGIARALLDAGADLHARDRKGDTPLARALNCRKREVAESLAQRGAVR